MFILSERYSNGESLPDAPLFKNSSSSECFLVDFPTLEKRVEDEVDGAIGDDGEFVSTLP